MHATLTDRQERFVFEYLKDQNASAAAARAGYTAKNMAQQGSELMNNPAVRERVRVEMQSLLAEVRASALELMKQRMRVAFFDPGKLLRGWEPRPLDELDEETRAVLEISTVLRKSGPVVRVKQADRHRALRALEKVHEKLELLNQKYWDKLEREGRVMSLDEIEAMDAQEVPAPASEIAQKPQVLSGAATKVAASSSQIFEIPRVLSGAQGQAADGVSKAFEKHQVLSGALTRIAAAVSRIFEKPQVPQGVFLRDISSGSAAMVRTPMSMTPLVSSAGAASCPGALNTVAPSRPPRPAAAITSGGRSSPTGARLRGRSDTEVAEVM